MNLINRPRRLRTTPTLRSMMRETRMSPSSLISKPSDIIRSNLVTRLLLAFVLYAFSYVISRNAASCPLTPS